MDNSGNQSSTQGRNNNEANALQKGFSNSGTQLAKGFVNHVGLVIGSGNGHINVDSISDLKSLWETVASMGDDQPNPSHRNTPARQNHTLYQYDNSGYQSASGIINQIGLVEGDKNGGITIRDQIDEPLSTDVASLCLHKQKKGQLSKEHDEHGGTSTRRKEGQQPATAPTAKKGQNVSKKRVRMDESLEVKDSETPKQFPWQLTQIPTEEMARELKRRRGIDGMHEVYSKEMEAPEQLLKEKHTDLQDQLEKVSRELEGEKVKNLSLNLKVKETQDQARATILGWRDELMDKYVAVFEQGFNICKEQIRLQYPQLDDHLSKLNCYKVDRDGELVDPDPSTSDVVVQPPSPNRTHSDDA